MTQADAITVFNMARRDFNAYKREIAVRNVQGAYRLELFAALMALAADFGARFPEAKEEGAFRLPKSH